MGITPADIDAMPDFTNAQVVKLIRHGIATLVANPAADVTINGRRYTYRDLDQLRALLPEFEARAVVDAANAQLADGHALVMGYQTDVM